MCTKCVIMCVSNFDVCPVSFLFYVYYVFHKVFQILMCTKCFTVCVSDFDVYCFTMCFRFGVYKCFTMCVSDFDVFGVCSV